MFDFSLTSHWSLLSAMFYVALGVFAMGMIYRANYGKTFIDPSSYYKNKYLLMWWLVWVLVAVCRFVNNNVGGADAVGYVSYFNECNSGMSTNWFVHVESDVGFKYFNKLIRFLFADYHVFFLLAYGFIAYAYIAFLKTFAPSRTNYVPYILSFYLFLVSFNTMRTSIATSLIALSCVMMFEKKWKLAYIVGFSSLFFHKVGLLYALCIPFCHFFFYRRLKVKTIVFLIIVMCLLARSFQSLFIQYADVNELNGAYDAYARKSLDKSFGDGAWKIAFEQLALATMMLVQRKKIGRGHNELDSYKLKIVWILCCFDFMLIPLNYILGIWRGYEFFYLARIVMWGECAYQFGKKMESRSRSALFCVLMIVFVAWMVFRIKAIWLDAKISPYVFEPFLLFQ